jgi:hypothetical protein
MPYIHYIVVKVMNNVSRKSLDWHPYKTAGIPDEKASFITVVLNLASVHSKDVEYVDCVQQYFRQETSKNLLSNVCWSGRLCSCLITTLLGDVASGLK